MLATIDRRNLRVLSDLIERTPMHLAKVLFNVLNDGCLLVKRLSRNDESFCAAQLDYHASKLASCTYTYDQSADTVYTSKVRPDHSRKASVWQVRLDTRP